jgi:hypothetical protein
MESIGQFNTSVQSRLLNGCATSGCHGGKSASSFRLACESPSRPVTRRMTFENFAACFQLIDRANPDQSPLLQYTSTPHAGLDAPVYRQGSKHFEAIADWVKTAALKESVGSTVRKTTPADGQVRLVMAFEELQGGPPRGERSTSESFSAKFPAATAGNSPAADRPGTGVDPFDPEIFNRLYGVRPASAAEPAESSSAVAQPGRQSSPRLQAPRRLSDSQKQGAIPIGKAKTE